MTLSPPCRRCHPGVPDTAATSEGHRRAKTVVWVSEGLPMPFDSRPDLGQLSALAAAAARVTALRDSPGPQFEFDASNAKPSPTPMEDRGAARLGLDLLAGVSPRSGLRVDWHRRKRLQPNRAGDDRVLSAECRARAEGSRRTHAQDQGHAGAPRAHGPRAPRFRRRRDGRRSRRPPNRRWRTCSARRCWQPNCR